MEVSSSTNNLLGKLTGSIHVNDLEAFSLFDQMSAIRQDCSDTMSKLNLFLSGLKTMMSNVPKLYTFPDGTKNFVSGSAGVYEGEDDDDHPGGLLYDTNNPYGEKLCYMTPKQFDREGGTHVNRFVPIITSVSNIDWTSLPCSGSLAILSLIYYVNQEEIESNYNGSLVNYWINHEGGFPDLYIPIDGKILRLRFRLTHSNYFDPETGVVDYTKIVYGLAQRWDYVHMDENGNVKVTVAASDSDYWWYTEEKGWFPDPSRDSILNTTDVIYWSRKGDDNYKSDLVSVLNDIGERIALQDVCSSIADGYLSGAFSGSSSVRDQILNICQIKGYDNLSSIKELMLQVNLSNDNVVYLISLFYKFYTQMVTAQADDSTGTYSFNENYTVTMDLQTTVCSVVGTVVTGVLSFIAGIINPIIGTLTYAVTSAISAIRNFKTQLQQYVEYPSLNFDSVLNNFEVPIVQKEWAVATRLSIDTLNEVGEAITMRVPGAILMYWVDDAYMLGNVEMLTIKCEGYLDLYQIALDESHTTDPGWMPKSPMTYFMNNEVFNATHTLYDYLSYNNYKGMIHRWATYDWSQDRDWDGYIVELCKSISWDPTYNVTSMLYQLLALFCTFCAGSSILNQLDSSLEGTLLRDTLSGTINYSLHPMSVAWNTIAARFPTGQDPTQDFWSKFCLSCREILELTSDANNHIMLEYLVNKAYYPSYSTTFISVKYLLKPFKGAFPRCTLGRPTNIVAVLKPPRASISTQFKKGLIVGVTIAAAVTAAVAVSSFALRRWAKQKSTNMSQKVLKARSDLTTLDPSSTEWNKSFKDYRGLMFRYSLFSSLTGTNGLAVSGAVTPSFTMNNMANNSSIIDSAVGIFDSVAQVTTDLNTVDTNLQSMGIDVSRINTNVDSIDSAVVGDESDLNKIAKLIKGTSPQQQQRKQ